MSSCSSSGPTILGMGNPLLDIQAQFSGAEITERGFHEGEAVHYEEEKHGLIYNDIKDKSDVKYIPGGGTQNSMRVAAALSSRPGWVAYMGCVGDDEECKIMEKVARDQGVGVYYQHHPTERTGLCGCLIDKATRDRVMVTRLGAASCFSMEHLEAHWKLVENAKVIYSAGFFVAASAESMLKVARYCAPLPEKFWACGLNAEFIPAVYGDQVREWFKYANLIVGNELEWPALARAFNWGDEEENFTQEQTLVRVLESEWKCEESKPRIAIATQGANPTIVAFRMNAKAKIRVETYPVAPLAKELIVDSNGCGDSFVGGFLYGWSRHFSLEKCVELGHLCGRELLQNLGNQFDLSVLRDTFA